MAEEYNVFISWSGERSKWVAHALHGWLPVVIQAAKPWLSVTNIDKGSRGLPEITNRLSGMKVGISCLTPENLNNPWILYEAGALSKTIDDKTRLWTYLLGGLQLQDVEAPLGMFQSTKPEKEDTRALVHAINKAMSDTPIPGPTLDIAFDALWPQLEEKLNTIPKSEEIAAKKRSVDDVVAEILEISRAEANNRKSLENQISKIGELLYRSFGELHWEFRTSIAEARNRHVLAAARQASGVTTLASLAGEKNPQPITSDPDKPARKMHAPGLRAKPKKKDSE